MSPGAACCPADGQGHTARQRPGTRPSPSLAPSPSSLLVVPHVLWTQSQEQEHQDRSTDRSSPSPANKPKGATHGRTPRRWPRRARWGGVQRKMLLQLGDARVTGGSSRGPEGSRQSHHYPPGAVSRQLEDGWPRTATSRSLARAAGAACVQSDIPASPARSPARRLACAAPYKEGEVPFLTIPSWSVMVPADPKAET